MFGRRQARRPWRALRGLGLWLMAAVAVASSAALGYVASMRHGIAALRVESNHRLDLFTAAVEGVIRRLEHLPATIQLNRDVAGLLREPGQPQRHRAVNDYLHRLNAHLGSLSVFVADDRGIVLASSNDTHGDDSRIGADVSFRPYFLDALAGRVGAHFAIGIDGGQPGYFVSHPIRDGARILGVAAIKINLEPVNQTWSMLGAPALLSDANDVVILASDPSWRFTALAELPVERRVDLQLTRAYAGRALVGFPLALELSVDEDSQRIHGAPARRAAVPCDLHESGMLVFGRRLDGMDWRVMMFADRRPVHVRAIVNAAMSAAAAAFFVLLAMFVVQRRTIQRQRQLARLQLERANAELEQKVAARTRELSRANARLRREVVEREHAQANLRATHDELVQAAKMATLGQLAAGITHELTQPLGALRTLSGNAMEFLRRGQVEPTSGNLHIMASLADQMGAIIQPLKAFARKSQTQPAQVEVSRAVGNALFLHESRLRKSGVELVNGCTPGEASVWCDPNRLEQVLVNLIGNAMDAMSASARRVLTIEVAPQPDGPVGAPPCPSGWMRIDVLDTGAGFTELSRHQLFEPFFTTKPSGAGLGLGLAISRDIAREAHGTIEAASRAQGGARFSLILPRGPLGLPPCRLS